MLGLAFGSGPRGALLAPASGLQSLLARRRFVVERPENRRVSGGVENAPGGPPADFSVHLAPAMSLELDAWIATLPCRVSRPQAIRAILAASLAMMKAEAQLHPMGGPFPPL